MRSWTRWSVASPGSARTPSAAQPSGRVATDFTLAEGVDAPRAESGQDPATRIERGAVTERAVARAAKAGSRLVLGPRAVLTPLARDRARVLGVEIEKEH